jgi:glycosyltransferase involved in cell wall biosynthesis
VHVAPLHDGPAPPSALEYDARNVRHVPISPSGGESPAAKVGVAFAWIDYVRVLLRELGHCDMVHVRCPANIGLLTILLLAVRRSPRMRWIKYAGNWHPQGKESVSYSLQRWLLRRNLPRAVVTVNGTWPGQPPHVRPFLNPCLTDEEIRSGARAAATKRLTPPLTLLSVGRVEEAKGCLRSVSILESLVRRGVDAHLEIVGDGPDRERLERCVREAKLEGRVRMRGWLARPALNELYAAAHVLLLPSASEGWPKVLSEGMAYGVVPLAGAVSCVPEYLERLRTGRAIDPFNSDRFVDTISRYADDPASWSAESRRATEGAARFGYAHYLEAVRNLLGLEAA